MTDPGRPESGSSGAGREPEDPASSTDAGWDPRPSTSSAPGELADLVTPKAEPAPVWPAPGSVPPWSEPGSAPPPAEPATPVSVPPGSVPPGAWTGPEGTIGDPAAHG